jgi:hypothetical protein
MERVRRGTAKSLVFAVGKNGPRKKKKVTTRRIVTLKDVNLYTKEETLKYTQIKLN